MHIIKTKEVEVIKMESQIVKETKICNKCGKEITPTYSDNFINFFQRFGYESNFDGETWDWDICPECLLEWIKTFKYVPDGFFQGEYNILSPEQHQKVFDNWKETDEWEEFKFNTYEELVSMKDILSYNFVNSLIKQYYPDKELI